MGHGALGMTGFSGSGQGMALAAYGLGLVVALWVMNQARRSFWLFSLLVLPGTFCHELCHWAVGKVLNGQPARFTILPRRQGRSWLLGEVTFSNLRWYNAFFVGLAPLALLGAAGGLAWLRLGGAPAPLDGWDAAGVYLLANLLFGALPSGQDLRIAARSPVGWLLLAGALAWGWHHLRSQAGRMGGAPHASGSGTEAAAHDPR